MVGRFEIGNQDVGISPLADGLIPNPAANRFLVGQIRLLVNHEEKDADGLTGYLTDGADAGFGIALGALPGINEEDDAVAVMEGFPRIDTGLDCFLELAGAEDGSIKRERSVRVLRGTVHLPEGGFPCEGKILILPEKLIGNEEAKALAVMRSAGKLRGVERFPDIDLFIR